LIRPTIEAVSTGRSADPTTGRVRRPRLSGKRGCVPAEANSFFVRQRRWNKKGAAFAAPPDRWRPLTRCRARRAAWTMRVEDCRLPSVSGLIGRLSGTTGWWRRDRNASESWPRLRLRRPDEPPCPSASARPQSGAGVAGREGSGLSRSGRTGGLIAS